MTNKELLKLTEKEVISDQILISQLATFDKTVREGIKDGDIDYLTYLLKERGFWE